MQEPLWHTCFPVNFVKRTPSLQNSSSKQLLLRHIQNLVKHFNEVFDSVLNMPLAILVPSFLIKKRVNYVDKVHLFSKHDA